MTSSSGSQNIPNPAAAQYREAAPSQEHKFLGFGQSYTDESDPSWEDVIVMVYIPGEPGRIKAASQGWRVLFDRINEIKRLLDDGTKDLESWRGQAGQAYRDHLTKISKDLEKIVTDNQRLPVSMDTAADNLQGAINKIEVPADMLHEVFAAKQSFLGEGNFDTSKWTRGAVLQFLTPIVSSKWYDQLGHWVGADKVSRALTEWFSDFDDKAKAAYRQVREEHLSTMSDMPNATNVGVFTPTITDPNLNGNPSGPGGAGKLPKSGGMPGAGGLPKSGNIPGAGDAPGTGNLPGGGTPSYPGSDFGGSDPMSGGDFGGSGLAGAGGGGLGGLGSGLNGLGGGGLGGLGGGGLGAGGLDAAGGGLGAGAAGRGGLSGMGGMMPGGMSGAGGAGAGKGAGRAGRRGMGGMGGMGGHGGEGDGNDHSTWLQEDDDVWGADSDAPPSVLG